MGVDWGGKDDGSDSNVGQSYSCVVILSASPNGTLLIEHAHKLRKQDFEYKKEKLHFEASLPKDVQATLRQLEKWNK